MLWWMPHVTCIIVTDLNPSFHGQGKILGDEIVGVCCFLTWSLDCSCVKKLIDEYSRIEDRKWYNSYYLWGFCSKTGYGNQIMYTILMLIDGWLNWLANIILSVFNSSKCVQQGMHIPWCGQAVKSWNFHGKSHCISKIRRILGRIRLILLTMQGSYFWIVCEILHMRCLLSE